MYKAYEMVRIFFGERKVKAAGIKGPNNTFIYEKKKIVKCRKEYLEKLYHEENIIIGREMDKEENQRDTEETVNRYKYNERRVWQGIIETEEKKAPVRKEQEQIY